MEKDENILILLLEGKACLFTDALASCVVKGDWEERMGEEMANDVTVRSPSFRTTACSMCMRNSPSFSKRLLMIPCYPDQCEAIAQDHLGTK